MIGNVFGVGFQTFRQFFEGCCDGVRQILIGF